MTRPLESDIKFYFVDVAPFPVFTRLKRLDNRMLRCMIMFGGVLIFGAVAAADVTTTEAQAQVYPTIAHLEAFFATGAVRFYVSDLFGVLASLGHGRVSSESMLDQLLPGIYLQNSYPSTGMKNPCRL
jgi:hypothetical protein